MKSRHQDLLKYLDACGACTYQELAKRLGVSTMTVRRDADELASATRLIKTLGGVQRADAPGYFYESALHARVRERVAEKRAIAREAMQLIESGQTLFLDGSTTCLELAHLMAVSDQIFTVITHSVQIVMALGGQSNVTVVGIGGQYDAQSLCFVGQSSEDWANHFFVDVALMSTKGFICDEGTFESSVATFRVKQIMARQCGQMALLVDHSKFGCRALCKVLDISEIHTVVTDDQVSQADLDCLQEAGKKVHVASLEQVSYVS